MITSERRGKALSGTRSNACPGQPVCPQPADRDTRCEYMAAVAESRSWTRRRTVRVTRWPAETCPADRQLEDTCRGRRRRVHDEAPTERGERGMSTQQRAQPGRVHERDGSHVHRAAEKVSDACRMARPFLGPSEIGYGHQGPGQRSSEPRSPRTIALPGLTVTRPGELEPARQMRSRPKGEAGRRDRRPRPVSPGCTVNGLWK